MTISNKRLYDNTRIQDFRRCPRYYFFRHIRGWKRSGELATALAFGSAWHESMDVVWKMVSSDGSADSQQVVDAAYAAWVNKWVESGMPEPDELDSELATQLMPRVPPVALDMLYAYVSRRWSAIKQVKIIDVERPFAVPLTPDDPTLFYIGRMDKIVDPGNGAVRVIEHKTTTMSKGYGRGSEPKIRPIYLDSYSPNSQVDGYLFALNLLYESYQRFEVWVDAALVHKSGEDFQFIPLEKQVAHLDSWLNDTHYWIANIEGETRKVLDHSPKDRVLAAFPKNTSSCLDYNRTCPYLDLCKARPNPLSWTEAPNGYVTDFWNPLDHIGKPKELGE